MPRLPEELIERIKREVSLVELCRDYGIELNGSGKNLLGHCPLHEDQNPSLAVTPSKNLWNCLAGCGGGDNLALVMAVEKVSFRRAADKLAARLGLVPKAHTVVTHTGATHEILADPGDGLSDARLMGMVAEFYHATFLNHPQAMAYLQKRKCFHPEAAKRFQIGYANRTLGYRVPKTTKAGQQLKDQLTKLGIYGRKGHEHLNGSVVFPIFDRHRAPVQMYGRKINEHLRKGTPRHLYLERPKRGIWNREGVEKQREWLLCESIIDALTLWCHGLRNVTCAFGVNGLGADLWRLVEEAQPKRVVICYDHDEPGEKAVAELSQRLAEKGVGTLRARLPEGCDINRLAVESGDAQKALAAAIEASQTLVALAKAPPPPPLRRQVAPPSLAAQPSAAGPGEPLPAPPPHQVSFEKKPESDELNATLGDRLYRVRGLSKNLSYETMKVQLKVSFAANSPTGPLFHLDNGLDLYSHKARAGFVKAAAAETGLLPEILQRDLGLLLLALEPLQEQIIRQALEPQRPAAPSIDPEQAQAALEFLRAPDLIERLLGDFAACGMAGEQNNLILGMCGVTSRHFDKPLGILVQSTSAAGKTTLMEAILAFVPEEERVHYSAMTGQALFYLGESDLKHKVLAVAEEEGAERAAYALKLLQSEGALSIASTGKDPTTGRMKTEHYHVQGPTMIFLTTTAIELDEELANRCLTLAVDESREQTRRIHALQREEETIEGYLAKRKRAAICQKHQNAQRLLKPVPVHNPYAPQLTFPDENTRLRRDQLKYLTLIRSIAFLHQYQRPRMKKQGLEHIVVSKADIALANRLAAESFGRSLDEMPPQTRRFLELLWKHVRETAKKKDIDPGQVRFSQRKVRGFTGWSQMQVKRHLAKLVELEYALVHGGGRGQLWRYELVYQGEGEDGSKFFLRLIDPATLRDDGKWGGPKEQWGLSGAPQGRPGGSGGAGAESPPNDLQDNNLREGGDENNKKPQSGEFENAQERTS